MSECIHLVTASLHSGIETVCATSGARETHRKQVKRDAIKAKKRDD
jgi:hypothetical protein